jgi:protein ImuB
MFVMKRVLCVWLPNFPLQRFYREQPTYRARPCVLFQQTARHGMRLVACSREAIAEGITPGISLADARILLPSIHFEEHLPDVDATALQKLAWSCQRFSPCVGIEHFGDSTCLLMDMTGGTHLFGGDHQLARQVIEFLSDQQFFSHVAIAPSIGAAWGISRYGHQAGASRTLRSLPVEALRIPTDVIVKLQAFDLARVDQLMKLPRQELPSRFGDVLVERLDQLFGRRSEEIAGEHPPEPVQAVWSSDDYSSNHTSIRHVCEDLLDEIFLVLRSRREGALRIELTFRSEDSVTLCIEQGMAEPSNSTQHVLELLMLRLEREQVPDGLLTLHIKVLESSPLDQRQWTLFSDDRTPSNEAYHRLLDRLITRLGGDAVLQPELLPEPLPEESVRFQAALRNLTTRKASRETGCIETLPTGSRPLCLIVPERISAVSLSEDGSPVSFHWRRRERCVSRCTRAERIETNWWCESGTVVRTYFRVETMTGERFLMFCDHQAVWFLHGIFD